jgi:hypothetical protein
MDFDDPSALVPWDLGVSQSRAYELRTVQELQEVLVGKQFSIRPLIVDRVELSGNRPDTLVLFRYHYRPEFVGRSPELVSGDLVEVAEFWPMASDEWSRGMMDGPAVLAAAIGSAFDAAELMIVDPETLEPLRRAPAIFTLPEEKMRRLREAN